MTNIIDEMPTLEQVRNASAHEIVLWHLYLRPTMSNDELPIVKAIVQRYDAMPPSTRERIAMRVRGGHG